MSLEPITYEEPADDEPSIFDIVDPEHDARVEAEADIAAGRLIPNEEVVPRLRTWGTPYYYESPGAQSRVLNIPTVLPKVQVTSRVEAVLAG